MAPDSAAEHPRGGRPPPDAAAELVLTVASVARRLGVAPATLRTWDRRYGLGPSSHVSGTHRRFTIADVERLKHMRRLTLAGMPAAEAARAVLGAELFDGGGPGHDGPDGAERAAEDRTDGDRTDGDRNDGHWTDGDPADGDPADPMAADEDLDAYLAGSTDWPELVNGSFPPPSLQPPTAHLAPARHRGSGGQVLALPGADAEQRGLARAAMALDSASIGRMTRRAVREHGVVRTWTRLIAPVLVAIGKRWEATGQGVEVEHLVSHTIDGVLRSYAARAAEIPDGRPVLLAAAPGEMHSLPLSALAAGLAERGLGVRLLGAVTPREALRAAVLRTGPSAVVIWSQTAQTADLSVLAAVPVTRPPVVVLTGGPGWDPDTLPAKVAHARDLVDGIRLVMAAAVP